jgi:hypothetical protein
MRLVKFVIIFLAVDLEGVIQVPLDDANLEAVQLTDGYDSDEAFDEL